MLTRSSSAAAACKRTLSVTLIIYALTSCFSAFRDESQRATLNYIDIDEHEVTAAQLTHKVSTLALTTILFGSVACESTPRSCLI